MTRGDWRGSSRKLSSSLGEAIVVFTEMKVGRRVGRRVVGGLRKKVV